MAKVKVQTVHSIELTTKPGKDKDESGPAQRPQTRVIPARSILNMNEGKELDSLREAGAVKEPDGKHEHDFTGGFEDGEAGKTVARTPQASKPTNPGAGANPAPEGADGDKTQEQATGETTGKTPAPKKTA